MMKAYTTSSYDAFIRVIIVSSSSSSRGMCRPSHYASRDQRQAKYVIEAVLKASALASHPRRYHSTQQAYLKDVAI